MHKRILTANTFLVIILMFFSCDKEETNVYPQTYESSFIKDIKLRVFTKNGEITDQVNIKDILEPINWLFTDLENTTIKGEITATYNTPDEVKIQEKKITDIEYRNVYNLSGISYWEKRDTTYTKSSLSEFEKFFTYHPIYKEEFTSVAFGTETAYKNCYYVIHDNEKLLLPMLDFALFEYSWAPKSGAGKIKNVFNDKTISKLAENDTLVVQSYTIEFLQK